MFNNLRDKIVDIFTKSTEGEFKKEINESYDKLKQNKEESLYDFVKDDIITGYTNNRFGITFSRTWLCMISLGFNIMFLYFIGSSSKYYYAWIILLPITIIGFIYTLLRFMALMMLPNTMSKRINNPYSKISE